LDLKFMIAGKRGSAFRARVAMVFVARQYTSAIASA
jgi:hypothetical protein